MKRSSILLYRFSIGFLLFLMPLNLSPMISSLSYSTKTFTPLSPACSTLSNSSYLIPSVFLWGKNYTDLGLDVVNDFENNIIIGGASGNPNITAAVLKCNLSGSLIWNVTYRPETNEVLVGPIIYNLIIDRNNTIYCVGEYFGAFLMKVSSSGEVLWLKEFGGELSAAHGIVFSADGSLVIAWTNSKAEIFLGKFTLEGTLLWNASWKGEQSTLEREYNLSVDSKGNFYVTGSSSPLSDEWMAMFVCKFSPEGELLWEQLFDWYDYLRGFALVVDSCGKYLYIAGEAYFSTGERMWDVLVCKLRASDGKVLWQITWGGARFDSAYDLLLDSEGNLLVCGETASFGAGFWDFFLCKFSSSDGQLLWQYTWGGELNDCCFGSLLLENNGGSYLYLVGYSNSFSTYDDILLLIFADTDSDGLTDGWEEMHGTNPNAADSDQDGLDDFLEVDKYGTNPLNPDSDDDGWLDGQEVWWHTNPLEPKSNPGKRKAIIFSTTIPILMVVAITLTTFFLLKRKYKREH